MAERGRKRKDPIKEQSEKKENILRRICFNLNVISLVQSNLFKTTLYPKFWSIVKELKKVFELEEF